MQRAIICPRVSDPRQVEKTSLDDQERLCREFCEKNGLSVVATYRIEGESAKGDAYRAELHKALEHARKAKVDAFVVWKLDRFARNQHDFHVIKARLAAWGIRLLSASETIPDSPVGRFLEGILAATAQFDNEVRADRSRLGMQSRAKAGWWVWRAPTGYRNIKTSEGSPTLEVDPETGPMVKRAFKMAEAGKPRKEILLALNVSPQTLHKLFRNPVYAGLLQSRLTGPEPIPGRWPAIVPLDLWHRVQERLSSGQTWEREDETEDFPLRGYVRCAECGRPLTGAWSKGKGGKKYPYYRCPDSHGTNVTRDKLNNLFEMELEKTADDSGLVAIWKKLLLDQWKKQRADIHREQKRIKRKVSGLEKKKDRLLGLYLDGSINQKDHDKAATKIALDLSAAKANEINTDRKNWDFQASLEKATKGVSNPCQFAVSLRTATQKRHFYNLMFRGVPTWDGKSLNTIKSGAVKALQQFDSAASNMVALWSSNLNTFIEFVRGFDKLEVAA